MDSDQMNENQRKALRLIRKAQAAILTAAQDHGPIFAEISKHGMILSGGSVGPGGDRRYFVCLASNDAAAQLEKWCNEQVDGRADAMRRAGLNPIVDGSSRGKNP